MAQNFSFTALGALSFQDSEIDSVIRKLTFGVSWNQTIKPFKRNPILVVLAALYISFSSVSELYSASLEFKDKEQSSRPKDQDHNHDHSKTLNLLNTFVDTYHQ